MRYLTLFLCFLFVGCEEELPPQVEPTSFLPIPGENTPAEFDPQASWQVVYNGKYRNYGQKNVITDGFGFHPQGEFSIAYLSAHYEDWRPDAKDFDLRGSKPLGKWKGERYIVWDHPKNKAVMRERILYVKRKGYHAIDWDNVDYKANSGGLSYFKWLIVETKKQGLKIGLKNAVEYLPHISTQIDFVVSEAYNKSEQTIYKKYGLFGVHMGYGNMTYPPLYRVRSGSEGNKY
jgi:hypothetical protein